MPVLDTPNDEKELLFRLREGDYGAFTALYHRYKDRVATNLFALLKDDMLVEDTLQELFFRVWERRASIDPRQPIRGYLFTVAANLAHDHFRKLARDQRLADAFLQTVLAHQQHPDTPYRQELDEVLYCVIDQLPPQRKRVFLLCKFESKSYQEVSQLLGISVDAVKDHITKANRFLKTHYPKTLPIVGYFFAVQLLNDIF